MQEKKPDKHKPEDESEKKMIISHQNLHLAMSKSYQAGYINGWKNLEDQISRPNLN